MGRDTPVPWGAGMSYDSNAGWSRVFVSTAASDHLSTGSSVKEVTDQFLEAVEDGSARDRYGRSFNGEAARELHWCLRGYFGEKLGAMSLGQVRRRDVEALVYELGGRGISRRRLRALAKSVRALYDYAAEQDLVRNNPAERVALPDEDEAEQPTSGNVTPMKPGTGKARPQQAIALALQIATLGFLVIALILLASSL